MTLLIILFMTAYGLLVVVRAMRFPVHSLSSYELKRRAKAGDDIAAAKLRYDALRVEMVTIHRFYEYILILVVGALAILAFGWLPGIGIAVALLLLLGIFSRFGPVRSLSHSYCWPRHEKVLMALAEKYARYIRPFRGLADETSRAAVRIHSREELLEVVAKTPVLSADDRQFFRQAAAFSQRQVHEIMTPRKDVVAIGKDEILGPLTLTALHKTGYSHLPVTYGGLDDIIGILPATEYMNTERQDEMKVEDVMRRQIFYLNEQQTLQEALQVLLHTKAHLFIVVDSHEKTVGILTLSDVITALFGRARNGKYQQYEDVHEVAKFGAVSSDTSTGTKRTD